MQLSELFEHLIHGELSQLSITNNGTKVDPQNYSKLASHIDLALIALFTRFNLRQEEVIIQQYDNISIYELKPQFALTSNSTEPVKYIRDSEAYPFKGELIKIEQAFDESGEEIPLNNNNKENSIFTVNYNSIQIPQPVSENAISIIYRAKHDKVQATPTTNLDEVEVNIPPWLVTPISLFIANNLINTINTVNKDGTVVGNNYLAKYEAFCARIESEGLVNKDDYSFGSTNDSGWV